MNTSTLRGALNAALRLPDDKVKAAVRKILEANDRPRGQRQTTGRFDTRSELEAWVWRSFKTVEATQSDIAKVARVSEFVVSDILSRPRVPVEGEAVLVQGAAGLVHHAFRSSIAPSGMLIGVYRHGPRSSYLGYLVSILPSGAKNSAMLPGFSLTWHGPFDNAFAGTSVSVVILVADRAA